MTFNLHCNLQKKEFICDLPFCRVLLEDNADFPWIFLVPKKEGVRNMCDLTTEERLLLMKEMELCEQVMMRLFHPTQINVAMIGNVTPQLHVHIICRFAEDSYWPDTVWGKPSRPYQSTMKFQTVELIKQEIKKSCQKQLS